MFVIIMLGDFSGAVLSEFLWEDHGQTSVV